MASPKQTTFWQDPLNLIVGALMFYSIIFYLLSYLLPESRHWLGLPQIYFLVVSWLIMRRCKVRMEDLGFRRREIGKGLLIGLVVSLVPIAVVLRYGFTLGAGNLSSLSARLLQPGFLYQLFVLVVLAPFSEELFFRGLLARQMVGRLPGLFVVIISTVLFAAAHFTWQPGPILLGLATGGLYLLYRSILPGLILHCLCNFLGPLLIFWAPKVYQELRVFFL